jgi:hypothetical protein
LTSTVRTLPYDRIVKDTTVSDRELRAAGVAGLAGTALLAIALLLPGAPPRTDEPSHEIVEFALTHRSVLLLGTYLAALATLGLLWLIAGASRFLRATTQQVVLVAGVLSGVLGLVFVLAGVVIVSGLVLEAVRSRDPVLVRAVTDTSNILIQVGLIGLGGFAIAAARAGSTARLLSRWIVWLGTLAGFVVVATSLPPLLVQSGAWQFGGVGAIAGAGPLAAWLVAFALCMARRGLPLDGPTASTASV